jgi:PAS domain S-box-containing protein
LDKTGKILECNLTAARMLGVEKRELLQANISKFVSRASLSNWRTHWRTAVSSTGKHQCEIEMNRADGVRLAIRLEGFMFGSSDKRRCAMVLIDVTQRKQVEDQLREITKTLEERLQKQMAQIRLQAGAIARLAEGVLITKGKIWQKSRIVFVNEAVSRITGYRAGELIGQSGDKLIGRATDRETLRRIHRELSAGNSSTAELLFYRKDGSPFHAELSITRLQHANGDFVSIHRDITERKMAEQAIRESEQRFRQLADEAPVMIWMSGVDKLCTFFNKPWLDFTGRTMQQEIGNGWADGVHPEDLARCLATYTTAFDARLPFTMEYRLRRFDGQWRWLLDSGIPLYQGSRVFTGYIGSCIDVTAPRQGVEALRASEERMRTILNTVSDSIITTDRRGVIVSVNPATERMFGYKSNELVGKQVKHLIPPSGHEEHDGGLACYFETGKGGIIGISRETRGLRKDGSTFPVELAVSEIPQLRLFTGILRDISARKEAERALDRYRKDLRTMASELLLTEDRERQRLAQDLHDGLGQALFRARMKPHPRYACLVSVQPSADYPET